MKLASLLFTMVLISGCSPIYYVPNTLNVPMIRAKGEGAISGHLGDEGASVQAAYSPRQNWGVMADGFYATDSSGSRGGAGHLISGGVGYYRPLTAHFLWDTYGILGFGRVENHVGNLNVRSGLVRYGIQPSIGFQSKYFDAFVSSRLVGLNYFHTNGSDATEVQYLRNAGTQFLLEPAVTLRGGFDFLKLQVQSGQSFNLTDSNFKQDEGIISLGVVYTFGQK